MSTPLLYQFRRLCAHAVRQWLDVLCRCQKQYACQQSHAGKGRQASYGRRAEASRGSRCPGHAPYGREQCKRTPYGKGKGKDFQPRRPRRQLSHYGLADVLVLLIDFQDVKFKAENDPQAFKDLLTKKGYDFNGATAVPANTSRPSRPACFRQISLSWVP